MTNEEFERRMEFIIEHQAQFTVDIQQLREVQTQFAVDIQQLREVQTQFAVDIQQLREAQAQTEQLVTRLVNVTFAGFKEVNAKIDALVDSQIRLTDALDRHLREGHNGESRR